MKQITNFLKLYIKQENGFSLVEMVIVLGILTFGLVGISALILQNMQVENTTKNNLIASMLSQEGIELVRNIRDENWVQRDPWLSGIDYSTFAVDYRGRSSVNQVPSTINDSGARLYLDGSGFYSHVASPRTTAFYRLITLTPDIAGDYLLLKSDVMWGGRFGERHYTIDTILFNWRGE